MPSRQLLGPLRPRQSCGPVPARFSCAATKEASAVASRIILDATARPEASTRPERTPPPSPRSLRSRARVHAALNCANFARNSARWWELPPPGAISSPPPAREAAGAGLRSLELRQLRGDQRCPVLGWSLPLLAATKLRAWARGTFNCTHFAGDHSAPCRGASPSSYPRLERPPPAAATFAKLRARAQLRAAPTSRESMLSGAGNYLVQPPIALHSGLRSSRSCGRGFAQASTAPTSR